MVVIRIIIYISNNRPQNGTKQLLTFLHNYHTKKLLEGTWDDYLFSLHSDPSIIRLGLLGSLFKNRAAVQHKVRHSLHEVHLKTYNFSEKCWKINFSGWVLD